MALLFEAPPLPFQTKLRSGTPINWTDPLSSGLILCWPANEGSGTCLLDMAWGSQSFMMRWGADSILGTGAEVPYWTTNEHTLALHLPSGTPAGTNIQVISPAYSGASGKMRPFLDYRKGLTLEFWGRPDGDPTRSSGMIGLEKVVGGQFMRFSLIGPTIDFRLSGGPGPGFIQSPTYASFAAMGNHFVATCTQGGEAKIYMNGTQVGSGTISVLTDELNVVNIAYDRNVLHDHFSGYFYKASVYNCVLGPGAVAQLAANPMRVLLSIDYPGTFVPGGDTGGGPGDGGGPTDDQDPDPYPGGTPPPYSDGSANKNIFIYYSHKFHFSPDPLETTRWDSYEMDFGWPRFKFIRRLWIAGRSSGDRFITLKIYVDEVLKFETTFYLITDSGTGWAKTVILLPAGLKGMLFRFVMTSRSPFKIWAEQSDIEFKPLSTDRSYMRFPLASASTTL